MDKRVEGEFVVVEAAANASCRQAAPRPAAVKREGATWTCSCWCVGEGNQSDYGSESTRVRGDLETTTIESKKRREVERRGIVDVDEREFTQTISGIWGIQCNCNQPYHDPNLEPPPYAVPSKQGFFQSTQQQTQRGAVIELAHTCPS